MRLTMMLLLLIGIAPALADEGVYSWRDDQGRVHYGDKPPEDVPSRAVEMNAKPVVVKPTERVYTWKDDEGNVHYSAKPPAEIPAEEVNMDEKSMSTIRATEFRTGERELLRELQRR